MGMLDRFRPVVTVGADSGELVFRLGDSEVRDQPLIRVAADGKIIATGEYALKALGGRLIRLFDGNSLDEPEALRAFCRYHILLASSNSIGLRPRVTILESQLRRTFGRDAADQLQQVVRADGFPVDFDTAT
jgi:hypothetical protein